MYILGAKAFPLGFSRVLPLFLKLASESSPSAGTVFHTMHPRSRPGLIFHTMSPPLGMFGEVSGGRWDHWDMGRGVEELHQVYWPGTRKRRIS